jgi:hypothetical protein
LRSRVANRQEQRRSPKPSASAEGEPVRNPRRCWLLAADDNQTKTRPLRDDFAAGRP